MNGDVNGPIEVEFMGGPADGTQIYVEPDASMIKAKDKEGRVFVYRRGVRRWVRY